MRFLLPQVIGRVAKRPMTSTGVPIDEHGANRHVLHGPAAPATVRVPISIRPVIKTTTRRESAVRQIQTQSRCGPRRPHADTTGDGDDQPLADSRAGKQRAVCPSSPMPRITASKGRGTRANVSHAETAPSRAWARRSSIPGSRCSGRSFNSTSRTKRHCLRVARVNPALVGETIQTRPNRAARCAGSRTGAPAKRPPDTTKLAAPREPIAAVRLARFAPRARATESLRRIGRAGVRVHHATRIRRPSIALEAAGPSCRNINLRLLVVLFQPARMDLSSPAASSSSLRMNKVRCP